MITNKIINGRRIVSRMSTFSNGNEKLEVVIEGESLGAFGAIGKIGVTCNNFRRNWMKLRL